VSAAATAWAWEQPVNGTTKLVLLALADHCGPTGTCWPGLKRVAQMVGAADERTVRRHVEKLEELGLLAREERRRDNGAQTSNLIRLILPGGEGEAVRGVRAPASGEPRAESSGARTGSKEPSEEPVSEREHPELSEWLGHHHEIAGSVVPRAGTQARRKVAGMFAARRDDGLSLEDLKAATLGAWHDDWRRENGHTGLVSVLRPEKCHELVSKGRRWIAAQAEKRTDWTAFDE
jgi:hypothetical protein